MLDNVVYAKQLPFRGVLMDSWYAERKLMLHIEDLHKVYYCPLKDNRLVEDDNDDSDKPQAYCRIDKLTWSTDQREHGRKVHVKGFPNDHRLELFRLVLSTERTDYVATNDMAQDST